MKKVILTFLTLGILSVNAANEKTIKANLDKVTVFRQGAQLNYVEPINFVQGTQDIILEGVSPYLDQNSLQAEGKGAFVIMDVKYRLTYKTPSQPKIEKANAKYTLQLKQIKDSLKMYDYMLDDNKDKREALTLEKSLLLNNRIIKGETKKDSLQLVKESLEYLRLRLNNINSELLKIKKEEARITELKNPLYERQSGLTNLINGTYTPGENEQSPIHQVIVTLFAEAAGTGFLKVNYFMGNAGWNSTYDLRAESTSNQIQLMHRAKVYQNSGMDWNNVSLTISTGSPNENGLRPTLQPYYLAWYAPQPKRKYTADKKERSNDFEKSEAYGAAYAGAAAPSPSYDELVDANYSSNYTEATESMVRMDYEIKLKYTILADGKEHQVVIENKQIPTQFYYSAVPKLDTYAYLGAKIFDWENLNLIPADARVYLDGAYVGNSYLNPNETSDTLNISLGRDKSIVIKRKKLKDKSKEKLINENKVAEQYYDITIHNTKAQAIEIEIVDQIPMSNDNNVKVEATELSKGSLDELSGLVSWKLKIKPKETKKLSLNYKVTAPKNKPIYNL
ncbi:MAG: DUF4139 domain-containing protein [Bacteroidota bacterium]